MRARILVRIGAIIFAAILMSPVLGISHVSACAGVEPKTGDLNADGDTNSLDALSVLFYQAGMMTPPDALWLGGADVNCDNAVNSIDASLILQVDAGLTTLRP